MPLHYIIDGYNLIKHRCFAPSSSIHDPRFALIQFLRKEKPCGSLKNKVTIVFDGYSGDLSLRGLEFEVIFSCEESADKRIKEMVENAPTPKNLAVVSDDREIRDFVKLCGAVSLRVEEFLNFSTKKVYSRAGDSSKAELGANATRKINDELRKRWLKE